jgi:hypothetical protein
MEEGKNRKPAGEDEKDKLIRKLMMQRGLIEEEMLEKFGENLFRQAAEQMARVKACLQRGDAVGAVLSLDNTNYLFLRAIPLLTHAEPGREWKVGAKSLLFEVSMLFPLPGYFERAVVRVEELVDRIMGRTLSEEMPTLEEVQRLWEIESPVLTVVNHALLKVEADGERLCPEMLVKLWKEESKMWGGTHGR